MVALSIAEYDLHSHTCESDGTLTPRELVAKAIDQGVKVLAITDHDCISGLADAHSEATARGGIKIINGIELSCRWQGLDIHVVGLDMDLDSDALLRCIQLQQNRRLERAKAISERLARKGFAGAYEFVLQIARSPEQITRPHFAEFLLQRQAVSSHGQAFKKYLGQGKPAYVATDWISIGDAIDVIHLSGGKAVLAHPSHYPLTKTKLKRLLLAFVELGGDSIEVLTSNQQPQFTSWLAQQSAQLNILASQGSDYHGHKMPWAKLGRLPKMPAECTPIWTASQWLN